MAFNDYLQGGTEPAALRYAPELVRVVLDTDSDPTLAQATQIWTDTYNRILGMLRVCKGDASFTPTAGTALEAQCQWAEAAITSCEVLRVRYGYTHSEVPEDAQALCDRALAWLEWLCEESGRVDILNGTSSTTTLPLSTSSTAAYQDNDLVIKRMETPTVRQYIKRSM